MLGHGRGSVEGGSGLSSIANVEGLTNLVPRLGLCQNYDNQFRNRNPILTQSSIYPMDGQQVDQKFPETVSSLAKDRPGSSPQLTKFFLGMRNAVPRAGES